MVISAGIEKFYTYAQFFTVLFLSLSLLTAAVLGVFILTRLAEKEKKRIFALLFFSFLLYLISELSLSVTPTHQAMTVRLYLNAAALGFLCRMFFLLSLKLTSGTVFPSSAGIILLVESALTGTVIAAASPFAPLFSRAILDQVQPAPLYFAFLSITLCWVFAGTVLLFSKRKRGFSCLAASAAVLAGAFILHHLLPGNQLFLILPAAVPVSVLLAGKALYSRNVLGILLHPMEDLLREAEMTILVINEAGRIISYNRNRIGFFSFQGCLTIASFVHTALPYITSADEKEQLSLLTRQLSFGSADRGTLSMATNGEELHLEYQAHPVRYLRGRVGWLVSIFDVTEETRAVRTLAEQEMELEGSYRELSTYAKSELYLKAERRREALIRKTSVQLEKDLLLLTEKLDEGDSLEDAINEARESLRRVRRAVHILKKGELEVG